MRKEGFDCGSLAAQDNADPGVLGSTQEGCDLLRSAGGAPFINRVDDYREHSVSGVGLQSPHDLGRRIRAAKCPRKLEGYCLKDVAGECRAPEEQNQSAFGDE